MVAVAQLVESRIVIPVVVGSNPISHPKLSLVPRSWAVSTATQYSNTRKANVEADLEKLEAQALKLAPDDRAALAQRLLASLEHEAEIEAAWAAEVERRVAEIESGTVPLIPIADALAQVRATLK